MNIIIILFIILTIGIFIEWCFRCLIFHLRKSFQWLIIDKFDEYPIINEEKIERFIEHGFDSELGWVRKPNSMGKETTKTVGESNRREYHYTGYCINEQGARFNPDHEQLPQTISTYGDSFVFSRQVENNETWQWYLSELTNSNVTNWGVGNYGFDQSLLRLKREYANNKTKIVIIGVVPETIIRILSVWKHYVEYGNLLGFKPRFIIEGGKLVLINNCIDSQNKFYAIDKYINEIKKYDYWYKHKFCKDILRVPYIVSLFKNPLRNIPLVYALLAKEICEKLGLKTKAIEMAPWELILKRNFSMCINEFQRSESVDLFIALIDEFIEYSKKERFNPVFVLFPYLHDLKYLSTKNNYFKKLLEKLASSELLSIDLSEALLEGGAYERLYLNDFYGSHLSKEGNQVVAKIIYESMVKVHLLG